MKRAEYASTQPEGPRRAERSEHGGPCCAALRGGASQQALEYTRYDNGQVYQQFAGAGAGSSHRAYTYGDLPALTSIADFSEGAPPATTTFSYDAGGNLTGYGSAEASTSFTYNPTRPHVLATVGANSYAYDASGNLESRTGPDIPGGTQTFEYTPFDLPTKITTGGAETEFEYSADEERVLRRDATKVRHFATDLYQRVVDTAGNTLEERFRLNVGGRELGEIVRKPGGDDQVLYFHTDQQGTVEVLSNSAGESFRREYDVWGAPQFSASEELTRAGYTGHQHDADLGLIDMRGRIYDPLAGRFLTPDPVMQAPFWSQGLNRYAYVFNDPVNSVDPSGFASFNDVMSDGVGLFVGYGHYLSGALVGSGFGGTMSAGLTGGTVGLGAANIYTTVTDPGFGGAMAGASGTGTVSQQGHVSPSDAARAALHSYNPASIKDGNEYGGLIYEQGGRYFFTNAIIGGEGAVDPWQALELVPEASRNRIVGDYHTHGSGCAGRCFDPFLDGEQFSGTHHSELRSMNEGTDLVGGRLDLTTYGANILDPKTFTSFLGTPSGAFGVHIPSSNTVFYFSPNEAFLPPNQQVTAAVYSW